MTCENCGREFPTKYNRVKQPTRFCSAACRRESYTLQQLQAGKPSAGYKTLEAYLRRRRRMRGNSPVSV